MYLRGMHGFCSVVVCLDGGEKSSRIYVGLGRENILRWWERNGKEMEVAKQNPPGAFTLSKGRVVCTM